MFHVADFFRLGFASVGHRYECPLKRRGCVSWLRIDTHFVYFSSITRANPYYSLLALFPLPSLFSPSQVGGHGSDQRSGPDSQGESSSGADKKGDLHPSKEGFLRHPRDSHVILKPVAKGQKGQVEKDFYRDLEHDDSGIQQFVPRFLGFVVLKSSKDGEPHEYIAMEDATHRFRRPCIADIKIGVRTFDPHASGSKIVKEVRCHSHLHTHTRVR